MLSDVRARYPGWRLVVGLNGDRRAAELKKRVLFSAEERAYIVSHLAPVDGVVIFEEDTPMQLIRRMRPNVFVKGPDYIGKDLPEADACEDVGCDIVFVGEKTHWSSELKGRLDVP